uniref:Uncharacterized protein n=1 Tax=Anthurium amnicola TaxID=1678845 RepID=A0A1D1XGH6_9ARAE
MTKKQRKKNNFASSPGIQKATLREENVGRKHVDSGSVLRMQHLQRLAIWAGGEASISPLAALLGHRLAVEAEAEGIPLDRSFFSCQRSDLCHSCRVIHTLCRAVHIICKTLYLSFHML